MKTTRQIQKDLLISSLFFLDNFFLNRSLQEKLRDRLMSIWSNIRNMKFSWDDTSYMSMADLKTEFYQPALLRCILSTTEVPKILIPQFFPLYLQEAFQAEDEIKTDITGQAASTHIQVQDIESEDNFISLRIADKELQKKINTLKSNYATFDILCCSLPFPSNVGKTGIHLSPHLLVTDIRPVTSPLQLIKAEKTDIEKIKGILTREKKNKGIFTYIRKQLIKKLKIANLERNPSLNIALSAVIIQAFSDGYINQNTSGKISCLIAGAPGSGKKLISKCAEIVNPVFTQAEPSKLSVAGICSSTQKRDDLWISRPGLIPLAHLGTFNLQDFHIVSPARKRMILGSLYRVLEDAVVIDSTSAHVSHEALTSILIDLNKASDLKVEKDKNSTTIERRLNDLKIPLPLLSRFDFIVDIPRDINQIDIALTMHSKNMTIKSKHKDQETHLWAKELQLLVAYLREKHREKITFTKEARHYITQKHSQLIEEYRPLMVQYEHFSDFIIRLSMTIYRFTSSISIMNDRHTPTNEDVDLAFIFADRKMNFIKSLVEEPENEKKITGTLPKRKERQKWILKYFAGHEMKIGHLKKEFAKFYGVRVNTMTLRLDLKDLFDKGVEVKQRGYYYIPEKREQKIKK